MLDRGETHILLEQTVDVPADAVFEVLADDHRDDPHVVAREPGRRIAWTTAGAGGDPAGVVWSWELRPLDGGRTRVALRHDWSDVGDPDVLAGLPRVGPEQLRATVRRVVEAARSGTNSSGTAPSGGGTT